MQARSPFNVSITQSWCSFALIDLQWCCAVYLCQVEKSSLQVMECRQVTLSSCRSLPRFLFFFSSSGIRRTLLNLIALSIGNYVVIPRVLWCCWFGDGNGWTRPSHHPRLCTVHPYVACPPLSRPKRRRAADSIPGHYSRQADLRNQCLVGFYHRRRPPTPRRFFWDAASG